jgi:hypothetical protein
MFMDQLNCCYEKGCTTKSSLFIQAIPFKIQVVLFTEIEKSVLKLIWQYKTPYIGKAVLCKMSNAGGIIMPVFRPNYKAIETKTPW